MKNLINAFKEHKEFNKQPWDIHTMRFPKDITTSPHYAETIEVLLCCNLTGTIYVGGLQFLLMGKQVFFIPPNVVHSVYYKKSDGYVKILKIHPDRLSPWLNIESILKHCGFDYFHLPALLREFDAVASVATCFELSKDPFSVCASICRLFALLMENAKTAPETRMQATSNQVLKKAVEWSEQHYQSKVSIEEIAKVTGYTKYHFCNKFKALTGITYLNYLNNLRVYHACRLLKENFTVEQTAELCGFENTSYFIQLFKKIVGTTPKKYKSLSSDS